MPFPQNPQDYNKITRLRYRLGSYGILCSVIGSIGYIGIGIFSIDRNYMNVMHLVSGAMAFGGFIGGGIFYGLIIVLYETKIPKIIGIYGIFGPVLVVILTAFVFLALSELITLFEWLLLFSIISWTITLTVTINFKVELQI